MSFQVVEFRNMIVEVQQVETGHRMSFRVSDDQADLLRASFQENPEADRLTKNCWKAGYFHAKRAARAAGLLKAE